MSITLTPTDSLLERLHLIPDALIERPQWLVWRNDADGDDVRKNPYQARCPRRKAKSNDPGTWATFAEAVDTFAEHLGGPLQFTGIGYVFSKDDPYSGVDLDDAVTGDMLTIHPAAREIIAKLGGYAEISPSQTGVKIWTRATLPFANTGRTYKSMPWGGQMEVYHFGRYFCCTGWEVTL